VGKGEVNDIRTTYSEGAPGQVFGILGSMGYLEIAANRASAFQLLGAGKGSEVNLVLEGAAAAGNSR
jgi:S-adenosylmethionine hydrolase